MCQHETFSMVSSTVRCHASPVENHFRCSSPQRSATCTRSATTSTALCSLRSRSCSKPRRCWLEPIDLRAGIETDSTKTERERELQILKVCLAEIERSRPLLCWCYWATGMVGLRAKTASNAAASEAGFSPEDQRWQRHTPSKLSMAC